MSCLKEDCFEEETIGKNFKIFKNKSKKYFGIVNGITGIEPIIPGNFSPLLLVTSRGDESSVFTSQPPIACNFRKPSFRISATIKPTSS